MAQTHQQLLPDYNLLLLADELVMDEQTYEGLIRGQIHAGPTVSLMAKLLREEGFIQLEKITAFEQKQRTQLKARIQAELEQAAAWIPAMRESVHIWQNFYEEIQLTLRPRIVELRKTLAAGKTVPMDYARQASAFLHDLGGRFQMVKYYADEALPPEGKTAEGEQWEALQGFLGEQLNYALANLQFGTQFKAGVHDWCDFQPFYQQATQDGEKTSSTRELFSVPLPEFIFWHPDKVIRALKSKRVQRLREAVRESVFAGAMFDQPAAVKILKAVGLLEPGVNDVRQVQATLTSTAKRRSHLQLISQSVTMK